MNLIRVYIDHTENISGMIHYFTFCFHFLLGI